MQLIEGSIADWSGVYLTTVVGATTAEAATGYAAFSIMMVSGRVFGDRCVRAAGEGVVLLISSISVAAGFALALVFAAFVPSVLGFALVGLGASNLVPVLFSAASRSGGVPPGTAVAIIATVGNALPYRAAPDRLGCGSLWASTCVAELGSRSYSSCRLWPCAGGQKRARRSCVAIQNRVALLCKQAALTCASCRLHERGLRYGSG